MPSRPLAVRLALLVAFALLSFTGCDCGRECTVAADCSGSNQICSAGHCVDAPDGGQTCSPACPISQFCDQASRTCKNCDSTTPAGGQQNRGCTTVQPLCDTTASGGAGQCRTCAPTSTDGGVDPGCFGTTPICDPAGNGGNGACVTCSARGGCGTGRVCDTSTASGVCRTCLVSTDGGVAAGCTAAAPICNQAQTRCLTCTATQGCAPDTFCDPNASAGGGACMYCRPSTDGGVAQGCSAVSPVCDLTRDGGLGACIICNATAGCGTGLVCDTAASAGTGLCKYCYDGTVSPDPGCTSGSPVCDVAGDGGLGQCFGCLASSDCTVAPNLVCDTVVGRCRVCVPGTPPEGCNPTQICDPNAGGGQGACLCNISSDCWLPDGGTGSTPFCRTPPTPGVCVECLATPDCLDPARPVCNTSGACGCAASAECSGSTPVCDTAANSGNGVCVVCTPTEGCTSPDAPYCASDQSACICRDNADCDVNELCTGSPAVCTALTQTNTDIPAFIAAAAGTVSIPIQNVYVTYIKPQVGSLTNDPAGFFVQAVAGGPAMFVAVDPGTVAGGGATLAGDRVSFTATSKVVLNGIDTANIVTGFTVLSTGHPVHNLATASPAGLVVDRSAVTDLVSALDTYESTITRLTGAIAGAFAPAGSGHSAATFSTAGVTGNTNLQIRVPDTLLAEVELTQGCQLTIVRGPIWRFNTRAQPSVYGAVELGGLACPGPKVLSAIARSSTSVEVAFDRLIDPATVQPADFSIPGLTVSAALVSSRTVTLTVDAQTADQSYTVTVTGIADTAGGAVDAVANNATFYGYVGPQTGLVINEIDYDQPGSDTAELVELTNIGTGPISLTGLVVITVNGNSTATPRRETARFRLSQVTDGTNPVLQLPPGGVIVLGNPSVIGALPAGTPRISIASSFLQNGGISTAPESDGLGIVHYATGTMIDALFYENSTQSPVFDILTGAGDMQLSFVEGTRTQVDDPGTGALQRKKVGTPAAPQDTGNNDADFELVTTTTPGVQ